MSDRYLGPLDIDGLSSGEAIEALFEAPNEGLSLGSFVVRNLRIAVSPIDTPLAPHLLRDREGLFVAEKISRTLTQFNTVQAVNDNGYADKERTERISFIGSLVGIDQAALAIPAPYRVDFNLATLQVLGITPNEESWIVRAELPIWQGTTRISVK